jgi:glycosyltransferase involved in cell wall biosynthesis
MTGGHRAVIVGLHDGWYGCGSGSGHSNRRVLELLDGLLAADIDLVVMPVRLDPRSPHADAAWHDNVRASLGMTGRRIRVMPADNGSGGADRFGGVAAFEVLAASSARQLAVLHASYDRALVLLLDVPFLGVPELAGQQPGWTTVVLPRSSAALHCPGNLIRVKWERDRLRGAAAAGTLAGCISAAMRTHLRDDLGVPASSLIDLRNGLTGQDTGFPPPGGITLPDAADRGFVLSYGRAVPWKGFEDLLRAWALLRQDRARIPHLVLAAVTEQNGLSRHQQRLQALAEDTGAPVTLLWQYSPQVRGLLTHPGVRAVAVPSRKEPFGRIPLEAYAAGAGPVVATTAGGLADLVTDGVTGFTAPPGDPAALARALGRAVDLDSPGRQRMLTAGRAVLARYDYRASVGQFLQQAAPWALPAQAQAGAGIRVLQIPEQCGWNPYIAAAESALAAAGATVLRPGWCADDPGPAPASGPAALPGRGGAEPQVVHLHWPEKLAAAMGGPQPAVKLLKDLAAGGAVVVQTVHNLAPHETSPGLAEYGRAVDQLTDGIICFSPGHESLARARRPFLPGPVLHLPHPLFPAPGPLAGPQPPEPGGLRIGCLCRLRGYKRTVPFARAFSRQAPAQATLLIAGACEDHRTDRDLRAIAARDPRVDYRPGFAPENGYREMLGEVDWVALPYQSLYSSGVLVAALQAGRRILSPAPAGGTSLYLDGAVPGPGWTVLAPWDDDAAIRACTAAARLPAPARPLALPSWDEAARMLCSFYRQLLSGRHPARAPDRGRAS